MATKHNELRRTMLELEGEEQLEALSQQSSADGLVPNLQPILLSTFSPSSDKSNSGGTATGSPGAGRIELCVCFLCAVHH